MISRSPCALVFTIVTSLLRVDEVADAVDGEQRDHQADDEDDRDVEEVRHAGERILFDAIVGDGSRRNRATVSAPRPPAPLVRTDALPLPDSSAATRSARKRCSRTASATQCCRTAATT